MMPSQTKHIPCGVQLDDSTRSEWLTAGVANPVAVNVRQSQRGALEKRLGFSVLSSVRLVTPVTLVPSSRTSGIRLSSYRGAPLIIDASGTIDLYEERNATIGGPNNNRGKVTECSVSITGLPRPSRGATVEDSAIAGEYLAVSHRASGEVTVSTASTGIPVYPSAIVASGTTLTLSTKLAAGAGGGSQFINAFIGDSSTGFIRRRVFETASVGLGFSTDSVVAAGTASATHLTMSACSMGGTAFLAFVHGTNVTVKAFTIGEDASITIATGTITPSHVAIDGFSGVVWLTWAEAGTVKCVGLSSSLSVVSATSAALVSATLGVAALDVVALASGARVAMFDTTQTNGTEWQFIDVGNVAGTTSATSSAVKRYSVAPSARMFRFGTSVYVPCIPVTRSGGTANPQNLLTIAHVDASSNWLRPVAHIDPGIVAAATGMAKLAEHTDGSISISYNVFSRGGSSFVGAGAGNVTATRRARLRFSQSDRWESVESDSGRYFAGGMMSVFDGAVATEGNFLCAPPSPEVTPTGLGAQNGDYRYVAVYEDVDTLGRVHVSGISSPSQLVSLAGVGAVVKVAPLTCSARVGGDIKPSSVQIALYRTLAGGSPPYYRVSAAANDLNSGLGLVSFTDQQADNFISFNRLLYAPSLPGTPGEALDRRNPGAAQHVCEYNGMIVLSIGSSVKWSSQQVYGEGLWWSPLFELPLDGPGDITALASQDGALYAFREAEIYALSGEAPSDNGLQGGITASRKLASDVGCISSRSVVVTSMGVFFRSRRGIELLTRAQAVEYVGQPIGTTLERWPEVTAAVLDDRAGLVRFSLTDAAGTSGVDAVYDLTLRTWVSTDERTGPLGSSQRAMDACVVTVGGVARYAWLSSDGTVMTERLEGDTTAWLDGSAFVAQRFATGQFNFGVNQEQQNYEMELLAERYSGAGVQITSTQDYGVRGSVQATWNDVEATGRRRFPWRVAPRSESVSLLVQETSPTGELGSGRGFCFVAISADTAPAQGVNRGTARVAGRK